MTPTAEEETKRRVVVGAIELCLARSEVVKVVEPGTVEIYFQSHPEEVWGASEVRLQPVWNVLIGQPGLTSKEVAPPLMVLKSFEHVLGMFVQLPPELGDVPASELANWRDALGLSEGEFSQEIGKLESSAAQAVASAPPAPVAAPRISRAEEKRKEEGRGKRNQAILAVVLALVALGGVAGSLAYTFRQTAQTFNLGEISSLVELSNARRQDTGLVAVITDAKWETFDAAKQREVAEQVFGKLGEQGLKSMTLLDGQGKVRVQGMEMNGDRHVSVR